MMMMTMMMMMIGRLLQVDAASNVNETLCAIWYHLYNLKT